MASRVVVDVNGNKSLRVWKSGPKGRGYVKVLVNIPAEYLAVMKTKNEECGGLNSVSEQIRTAIRGHLCGLVYISLFKQPLGRLKCSRIMAVSQNS
jgi:hypothetical protein